MRGALFFCLFICVISPAMAGEVIAGPVRAQVTRVIDGDTVRVAAQIWVDQEIDIAVRIADIDAPEIFRPKCANEKVLGQQAKAFVAAFLGDGPVYLVDVHNGKYAGRVVARVINADGADLSHALVDGGFARAGKRGRWCEGGARVAR